MQNPHGVPAHRPSAQLPDVNNKAHPSPSRWPWPLDLALISAPSMAANAKTAACSAQTSCRTPISSVVRSQSACTVTAQSSDQSLANCGTTAINTTAGGRPKRAVQCVSADGGALGRGHVTRQLNNWSTKLQSLFLVGI